jgi:hypothetical protein
MFKSKTVFIVGAGASQEAGLPTGAQLKREIASKLNITYKAGINLETGDGEIAWALVEAVKNIGTIDFNSYLAAAWQIRDAMPQAISIDNFIDAHSTNPGVVLCGKLGIVQAIRDAEQKSMLYIDERQGTVFNFNHQKIENTWYSKFFQLLTENIRQEDVNTVFDNISFITFNYDRCIEHYLYHALQNYYRIDVWNTQQIMQRLNISHPYGMIGRLPWQNSVSYVPFGGRMNVKLLDIVTDIRTFTERIEDDPALAAIRHQIQEAETVVFLGFAFHELNMQLLSSAATSNARRVFGTAKGISNADLVVVERSVIDALQADTAHASGVLKAAIKNELTCAGLFEEYWRSLSQGV